MSGIAHKVKQHCQCWAESVQALACSTAVEEHFKSGKVRLPGFLDPVNDLHQLKPQICMSQSKLLFHAS